MPTNPSHTVRRIQLLTNAVAVVTLLGGTAGAVIAGLTWSQATDLLGVTISEPWAMAIALTGSLSISLPLSAVFVVRAVLIEQVAHHQPQRK